jgi:transglutaminase superfamily protein
MEARLVLFEAVFSLLVAGVALSVLPFRHVGFLAASPTRRPAPSDQERTMQVRRIRWAITTAARWVPWRAMCFQQGLAAQFMLRRRSIPSVLYYGAAPDDQRGLSAHVWVRDRDMDVIGGEVASYYAVLATFPPQLH